MFRPSNKEPREQALARLEREAQSGINSLFSPNYFASFMFDNMKPDHTYKVPAVKQVLHSGPATIVFWVDGTKTIVRCGSDQEFDPYTGFIAAFAKKMYGSTSRIKKMLKKVTAEQKAKVKTEDVDKEVE